MVVCEQRPATQGRGGGRQPCPFWRQYLIWSGGVLDVASEMRSEKHTKDFGQSLGYWGVAPGPYLVLPLLGPSSLRETVALPVDMQGDIVGNIAHVPTKEASFVLKVEFPLPTGINVNMMPFVIDEPESLPENIRPYWNMLFSNGKPTKEEENQQNGRVA